MTENLTQTDDKETYEISHVCYVHWLHITTWHTVGTGFSEWQPH